MAYAITEWFDSLQVADVTGYKCNPIFGLILRNNGRKFRIKGIWRNGTERTAIDLQELEEVKEQNEMNQLVTVLKPKNGIDIRTINYSEWLNYMRDGKLIWN